MIRKLKSGQYRLYSRKKGIEWIGSVSIFRFFQIDQQPYSLRPLRNLAWRRHTGIGTAPFPCPLLQSQTRQPFVEGQAPSGSKRPTWRRLPADHGRLDPRPAVLHRDGCEDPALIDSRPSALWKWEASRTGQREQCRERKTARGRSHVPRSKPPSSHTVAGTTR